MTTQSRISKCFLFLGLVVAIGWVAVNYSSTSALKLDANTGVVEPVAHVKHHTTKVLDRIFWRRRAAVAADAPSMSPPPDDIQAYQKLGDNGERMLAHDSGW